ncbi:arylsulfatase J-like isoform X2 [Littorina saxatilis]|uniref:Sulfatase N-terminal domain-containing protein n=1 Tax=Littorina saxatilis TaxID=31220 RepID=A0AAN9BKB0_9CAEN
MATQHSQWRTGLALLVTCSCLHVCRSVTSKPNILIIFADDLGWSDVGFNDNTMRTPNIDKMAKEGVNMSSSYMNHVCSPSRAAFLTGKYPFKMGLQHSVFTALKNNSMPTDIKLLPEHLQELGYATHFVGKWHLGFCMKKMTPTQRGFDTFYGMYNGKGSFYTHISKWDGYDFHYDTGKEAADYKVEWAANGTYSTNLFSDKTIDILKNHNKTKPFFIMLSYQAVHGPLEAPDYYVNTTCAHITVDSKRKTKCGMAAAMDAGIGNVTSALDSLGFSDNLITLFVSDNGGPTKEGSSNWPLRGSKITLWEGGTRVVSILHSKKYLPNQPYQWGGMMHSIDWYPTLMKAAGYNKTITGIDGVDNWSPIVNNGTSKRTEFVYNINDVKNTSALRVGKYKLITKAGKPDGWSYQPANVTKLEPPSKYPDYLLFNIDADPSETTNLINTKSLKKTIRKMKRKLKKYRNKLVPTKEYDTINAGKPKNHGGAWVSGWCDA